MIIRSYQDKDDEYILNLSSRFYETPSMAYRDLDTMRESQNALAEQSILKNKANIFIVEQDGEFLGYLEMTKQNDYFTKKPVGYIAAIAVTTSSEGKGVGKMLMRQAELWCKTNKCTELVLDVFRSNEKAIAFYKHLGFEEEIVKMVKVLK